MTSTDKTPPQITLDVVGLTDGVWTATLRGVSKARRAPDVTASLDGTALTGLEVTPHDGEANTWDVRLAVPAEVLRDGTSCILFHLDGAVLADLVIHAGAPVRDDLRAEFAVLRAELDLLKRMLRAQLRGD